MLLNLAKIGFNPNIIFDKNLVIQYWNDSAESQFGIARGNVIGEKIFSIFPSLEKELDYYLKVRIFEEKGDLEIQNLEIELPKSRIKISFKVRLKYFQDENKNELCILFLNKNSFLKYDSEYFNLINAVINNSRDAVLITNAEPIDSPDGPKIIFANPAFYQMTGYTEKEILGKTPRILQGEKTSKDAKQMIRTALENRKPIQIEILNYKKDGSVFWSDLSIVPLQNEEGWNKYWISIQRETTERRELEDQLREHNENLGKLVAARTKELEDLHLKQREEQVSKMKIKAELDQVKLEAAINELELKKQKLIVQEMKISESTIFINKIKDQLKSFKIKKETPQEITKVIRFIERENLSTKDWDHFVLHFEDLHKNFFIELNKISKSPLNAYSKKHCAFIKLGLSTNEVASILHIEPKSVEMARYRIKKQLNLSQEESLQNVIQNLDS